MFDGHTHNQKELFVVDSKKKEKVRLSFEHVKIKSTSAYPGTHSQSSSAPETQFRQKMIQY